MNFTKIRLVAGSTTFDFPIRGVLPTTPYILKAADGLGPPEANIFIADTLFAGGIYQNRKSVNREIVLRVALNPNYAAGQSVSDLRTALYAAYIPDSSDGSCKIEIRDDSAEIMHTYGYVKTMEIVPFSEEPEMQITLSCTQPYFQHPSEIFLNAAALASYSKTSPVITNPGSAPCGFELIVTTTIDHGAWGLTRDSAHRLVYGYGALLNYIASGTNIKINTIPQERELANVSGGIDYSLIDIMTLDSQWLPLKPGTNTLSTSYTDGVSTPLTNHFNWVSLRYTPLYLGV